MMNSFNNDSLDDSRVELKYLEELKQKDQIIKENGRTIASLRGQLEDFKEEIEELEKNEEVLKRDLSKFKKELSEKDEELEAVAHTLKEIETANENLNKRYNARVGQLQKFVEELTEVKKQNEELKVSNEKLIAKNDLLAAQLSSKELALRKQKRDEEDPNDELRVSNEKLTARNNQLAAQLEATQLALKAQKQDEEARVSRELNELRNQVASLKSQLSSKQSQQQTATYRFPTVDEVGEYMNDSSVLGQDKRRLEKSALWDHHHNQIQHQESTRRPLEPQPQPQARDNHCVNHRIQKSQLVFNDPIAEEKQRLARLNELARRNKLTKPLHRTSYALELETFDESLGEVDIKRGEIRRRALADFSNQRKPEVKKPVAFIV